jgi:hypothetical protein
VVTIEVLFSAIGDEPGPPTPLTAAEHWTEVQAIDVPTVFKNFDHC